ncbi:MAG TPA: serine/threonine-protein kinase [Acidimicrobiales bacterium]
MRRRRRGAGFQDILSDYSGLSDIGSGPFANVYGAVENETGQPVALKIFETDAGVLEILSREIKDLGRVDHPNVLIPRRVGSTPDDRPVVVMDLCGQSLAQVIGESGPLSAQETAGVGIKIASGLAAMHEWGFAHQNVKPQNILSTLMGEPALSDPGESSLHLSVRTMAGGGVFTAFHSPPEKFEGHAVTPATDVYGLASTMYQLLSGRAPFQPFDEEPPISVVLRILRDPVAPLPADVPFRLAEILAAGLEKSPAARPPSAAAFADLLREAAAQEGWTVAVAPARQPSPSQPAAPSADADDLSAARSPQRSWRRNRRGVTQPQEGDRNVVLPEGSRRGSMDRPPRSS